LWIDQNGRYGFEGSWIPIGILNIQNMAIQGFPGAEAFYPRHLDSATRAHLEEELHDLLNRQGTPPYFRSYNDGRGARSYYRPSATSTPDPAVPQPSREEASSGKQQHTRRERDEEFERERREREEQFRREQQDREESRKRQQQEREAKARSEETAKRQREKAAKEAEAQRNTNRWKEYNRAWAELRNMPAASRASRNPRTAIPWPTDIGSFRSCHDVSPYDIEAFFGYGVSVSGRGQLLAILKVERSKWHPDKVQHLFGAQVDEPTMDRVTQISQIVNQLYTQEQAKAP
jgi:flagellar biosynthesis GTPase FlhF